MKRLAYQAYLSTKKKLNYWIDRYIEFAYLFLSGYHELPWPVAQKLAQQVVRSAGDFLFFLKDFPRLTVTRMSGPDWTVIYVGGEASPSKENQDEFVHFFFKDGALVEPAGRVSFWNLQKAIDRWLAQDANLVICELSRFRPIRFHAPIQFQVPIWVHQVFQIPQPEENLLKGKNSKGLRLARRAMKAGYSYRVSYSDEEFDFFYHRMYAPYLTFRHNDLALLTPYENLKKFFHKGGLVLIEKENQPKAGAVGYVGAGEYKSIAGGILDADPELFQEGVHVYNTLCEAKFASQLGARKYDMGASFPIRTSGVYHHKTLWGAKAEHRRRIYPDWLFLSSQIPEALCQHLNDLQPIVEIKDQFYGLRLVGNDAELSSENIPEDVESAHRDGLSGAVYIFKDGQIRMVEK